MFTCNHIYKKIFFCVIFDLLIVYFYRISNEIRNIP